VLIFIYIINPKPAQHHFSLLWFLHNNKRSGLGQSL